MYHYIYRITILCGSNSGRYYIGKHSTKNLDDGYAGSGLVVQRHYKKYGKIEGVTYKKEILEYNETEAKNTEREREILADIWDSDENCLNLRNGGDGMGKGVLAGEKNPMYGKPITDAHRRHLIDSHKGIPSTKKGIPISEEQKRKQSIAMKGKMAGEKHPRWGKHPSEETKEKLRTSHLGQIISMETRKKMQLACPHRKEVLQYSKNGEYIKQWISAEEAYRVLGIAHHIGECCEGKRKTCGGYVWQYAEKT